MGEITPIHLTREWRKAIGDMTDQASARPQNPMDLRKPLRTDGMGQMLKDIEANHKIKSGVSQMSQGLAAFALRHGVAAVALSQANLRWAQFHPCGMGKPQILQSHDQFTLASAEIQSRLAPAGQVRSQQALEPADRSMTGGYRFLLRLEFSVVVL